VQAWLFSLKVFRLLGPSNGIGLVEPAKQLLTLVERRAMSPLLSYNPGISPEEVSKNLYGTGSDRLAEIRALMAQIRAGQEDEKGSSVESEIKRAASPNIPGGGS